MRVASGLTAFLGTMLAASCVAAAADTPAGGRPPQVPDRWTFAGRVMNERGEPVAGAAVDGIYFTAKGTGYIGEAVTGADGRFVIDREPAGSGMSRRKLPPEERIQINVSHDDFVFGHADDLQSKSQDQLNNLEIRLRDGRSLRGRVVDAADHGVDGAVVRAEFHEGYYYRKGAVTNADGDFVLRGLPPEYDVTLLVLANEPLSVPARSAKLEVPKKHADEQAVTVHVAPIKIPDGKPVHTLLGMKLVDNDAGLNAAFHRPDSKGVTVIDPGEGVARLDIGDVRRGDQFWIVGEGWDTVSTVADLRDAILAAARPSPAKKGEYQCRVVYRFSRRDFNGTNTQYLRLTKDDMDALRKDAKGE